MWRTVEVFGCIDFQVCADALPQVPFHKSLLLLEAFLPPLCTLPNLLILVQRSKFWSFCPNGLLTLSLNALISNRLFVLYFRILQDTTSLSSPRQVENRVERQLSSVNALTIRYIRSRLYHPPEKLKF